MTAHSTEIPELGRKGLREFAFTMGAVIAVLFGLILPWLIDHGFPIWPWVVAGVFLAWGLVAPMTLRPLYRGWMRFGLFMNRIVTPVILGAVFFLVITPTSFVMRLLRRDPMDRRFDAQAPSYRVPAVKPPREKMEKPY